MRESELFAAYSLGVSNSDARAADEERHTKPPRPEAAAATTRIRKLPGANGCWLWAGRRDQRGYGVVVVNGEKQMAHRVIWEAEVGQLDDGQELRRQCGRPACVRPSHMVIDGDRSPTIESIRRRDYLARRREAVARSIPYTVNPQPVHALSTAPKHGAGTYPRDGGDEV